MKLALTRPRETDSHVPLDWRAVDWPRVARATYEVRQHYRYSYTGPISDLQQRLVMVPPDAYLDQRLFPDWELQVRGVTKPGPQLRWEQDADGNRVARVLAGHVENAVDFEVRYRVLRGARRQTPRLAHPLRYLHHTALTAPNERLSEAARGIVAATADPLDRAERANAWAAQAIDYQLGITGVQTPASMALQLGRGVCQDYAHILLCLLRLMGTPARYVSGQLLGEGAPHAWVEAFVGDEPIHLDPTHRRHARMDYVVVAVGRDFADVTPASGAFTGSARGRLSSHKEAAVSHVSYADGTRAETRP